MNNKPLCIYGLTGGPVHNGHVESYEWLKAQGYLVIVVPAIGHEFKPEALATYIARRLMCQFAFGGTMMPLEEMVLDVKYLTDDLESIKAALKQHGRPVMAIDLLRTVAMLQHHGVLPEGKVHFAIGPDINVDIWTGIEDIRKEFKDCFVTMPEVPGIRSTLIRSNIEAGLPWEHMVPTGVAKGREGPEDVRLEGCLRRQLESCPISL
jgi:nicotinic acid mononucleotide adenylyltransferase